jgi:PAS domain S-box-containing protein
MVLPAKPATSRAVDATGVNDSQFHSAAYAAFRAVFDSSDEALVIISPKGAIQTANLRARQLLKLENGGINTNSFEECLTASASDQLKALSRRGETFTAFPREADSSIPPKSPIQVTLRAILPISQHLLLSLQETHDPADSLPHQRELEAELRAILDSVQPGILIFDLRGHIRWSNPRFAELMGLERIELESTKTLETLSSLLSGRFRNPRSLSSRWRELSAGRRGPAHDDLEILQPTPRLLERFSRTITDHGRTVGWLEIYSDVTERRQIQSKMLQTEKLAALGKVVAGIAHELNNPLTGIMGNAQLLLARALHPAALAEARRVYQESERARRIVKNLLYFARENRPERSIVDLNEIVERTAALRSYESKIKNVQVRMNLASGLPRTMADPHQLQQVVLNLLINAEQAVFEGRGQGSVRIRTWSEQRENGPHIFLEVADDGPGIPSEIAPRIFDPFFTTKAPDIGTGLGLSIVYGIIRQHDGEVSFDSQSDAGAKFVVDLPVVAPPAEMSNQPALDSSINNSESRSASRILVVEDEPTVARLVVDVLQGEGYRVTSILDSREGLESLSHHSYDLVICDLRMPHIDGRSFFRALQSSHNPMQRKVMFITGDTMSPSSFEFLAENRLPFLAKPFLVEELKLAVRQQLQKRDSSEHRIAGKTISHASGGRRSIAKRRPSKK